MLSNRGKSDKKEARSNWWRNDCSNGGLNDRIKNKMPHVQHIPPILWAKVPKKYLKENEVTLSIDFSKNYQNKQHHEIQSTYFGLENFILFTAVWYLHRGANIESFSSNINHDSCLVTAPVAVVSNGTSHDHNVAHSQITTNWSPLYKKLIQLSIHFIFGLLNVLDNLGPNMYSIHFPTAQQISSWLGTMVKPIILKVR